MEMGQHVNWTRDDIDTVLGDDACIKHIHDVYANLVLPSGAY